MSEFDPNLEQHLQRAAENLPYPTTPMIRLPKYPVPSPLPSVRLGWMAAVLCIVIVSMFAIPPIRAAVLQILQVGAVEVTVGDGTIPADARPLALADLPGEMTLDEAIDVLPFRVYVPRDYGMPDYVFVPNIDNIGEHMILMVWVAADDPQRIELALYAFDPNVYVPKSVEYVAETSVNGLRAVWTDQPHIVELEFGNRLYDVTPVLVENSVLIWVDGYVTYRLEGDMSMEEAVQIAESLQLVMIGE